MSNQHPLLSLQEESGGISDACSLPPCRLFPSPDLPLQLRAGVYNPPFRSALQLGTGENKVSIFTILFIILLIAWILGWGVFHVACFLIHLLLIAAVIALILHFVRRASRAV